MCVLSHLAFTDFKAVLAEAVVLVFRTVVLICGLC